MNLRSHINWSSLIDQCRPSCFNSPIRRTFTLLSLLRTNVAFPQTQKPLPPSWRPLWRPHWNLLILIIIIHKKLFPQSSGGPLHLVIVAVVLVRQQPSFEEKLISTHHGIVCDRKLKVWGHCSRCFWSGASLLLHGLLHIHKVVWEGDSGAHWSAVMVMMTLVLGVIHF